MARPSPSIYLLTHAIDRAAELFPDRVAVRCGEASLTYSQLVKKSDSLARCLRVQGVQRGDRVGLLKYKSVESIVAMYGIMKAGAAFVPLDAAAPVALLASTIADCGIGCVVADINQVRTLRAIAAAGCRIDCVIGTPVDAAIAGRCVSWAEVQSHDAGALETDVTEQDIAYILHTSGSTGKPKGIVHTHRSGLAFAQWASAEFGLCCDDVLSNHAPLHFDLSTFDFFAGALAGATTVMLPETLVKLPASVSRLMQEQAITVWYSVPLALTLLLRYGQLEQRNLQSLRRVLFAGESFPPKYLRSVMSALPGARFSNLYGPTETNVCTCYHVSPTVAMGAGPVPIGRACDNVTTRVVNSNDEEVADGHTGELLVRGAIVMSGYWNRAPDEHTFYRRASRSGQQEIFYRTGDLVRRSEDGNFALVGRRDRQVKARGYRVELDAVEAALLSHPQVVDVAAIAVPDADGSLTIVAIATVLGSCTPVDLKDHAARQLPWFAVPARIVLAEELPRTSTGKIDRSAVVRIHGREPVALSA